MCPLLFSTVSEICYRLRGSRRPAAECSGGTGLPLTIRLRCRRLDTAGVWRGPSLTVRYKLVTPAVQPALPCCRSSATPNPVGSGGARRRSAPDVLDRDGGPAAESQHPEMDRAHQLSLSPWIRLHGPSCGRERSNRLGPNTLARVAVNVEMHGESERRHGRACPSRRL